MLDQILGVYKFESDILKRKSVSFTGAKGQKLIWENTSNKFYHEKQFLQFIFLQVTCLALYPWQKYPKQTKLKKVSKSAM